MYAVVRHGARYATAKRAAETDKLKAMLINRLGRRFASHDDVHKQSTTPKSSQSHGDLSELGMIEQYCLAIRLKAKVPELLQQPYSKQHYNFRTSQTSRAFKRYTTLFTIYCPSMIYIYIYILALYMCTYGSLQSLD